VKTIARGREGEGGGRGEGRGSGGDGDGSEERSVGTNGAILNKFALALFGVPTKRVKHARALNKRTRDVNGRVTQVQYTHEVCKRESNPTAASYRNTDRMGD
jgi:hypothetical protein